MNTKGEVSKDFPLDILIIIGSLLTLKDNFNLDIVFIIGDQNAILQIGPEQSNKIKEINDIAEVYSKKLCKILKYFNLLENSSIIKASSLIIEQNYQKIKIPPNYNTPYANEQLKTMKYFKLMGYNYRLSWKGDKKRKHTKNDEEYFDNLYLETFKEKAMTSIYIKSGKKSLPHGLGTAIPYSYYESEEKARVPFKPIDNFNFQNEKIKNHSINILKFFIKGCEINEDSYNNFVRKCLS